MFKFDHATRSIICSKTALRKAGDPATKEYKELTAMMEKQPDFKVVAREIKKSANKATYKGLTTKAMRDYIGSDTDRMVELDKALEMGGYPMAKHWFLETYEKPTMTKVKNKVSKARLAKIRVVKAPEAKLTQMLLASGQ